MTEYNYRNCQSLFGYAARVHARSGGICQLCGAAAAELGFDFWRQLTVEHLIGESQGGYLKRIKASLLERFPALTAAELTELAARIDESNTVTACSFCNSTTSRAQAPASMNRLIETAPDATHKQILAHITGSLDQILNAKRAQVAWKLASVRQAFDSQVAPGLTGTRPVLSDRIAAPPAHEAVLVLRRVTCDVVPPSAALATEEHA